MKRNFIYRGSRFSANVSTQFLSYLESRGVFYKSEESAYIIPVRSVPSFYSKMPVKKSIIYLSVVFKNKGVCKHCGKSGSLHVSPAVTKERVDFSQLLTSCKSCRESLLKRENLEVPVFQRNLKSRDFNAFARKRMVRRFSKQDIQLLNSSSEYISKIRKLERLRVLVRVSLPSLDLKHYRDKKKSYESLLRAYGVDGDSLLDLKSKAVRSLVRNFLQEESSQFCPCCGEHWSEEVEMTIDHIIPISSGGKDIMNNFVALCFSCNQSKSNTSLLNFLMQTEHSKLPYRLLHIAHEEQENVRDEFLTLETYLHNLEARLLL